MVLVLPLHMKPWNELMQKDQVGRNRNRSRSQLKKGNETIEITMDAQDQLLEEDQLDQEQTGS